MTIQELINELNDLPEESKKAKITAIAIMPEDVVEDDIFKQHDATITIDDDEDGEEVSLTVDFSR